MAEFACHPTLISFIDLFILYFAEIGTMRSSPLQRIVLFKVSLIIFSEYPKTPGTILQALLQCHQYSHSNREKKPTDLVYADWRIVDLSYTSQLDEYSFTIPGRFFTILSRQNAESRIHVILISLQDVIWCYRRIGDH